VKARNTDNCAADINNPTIAMLQLQVNILSVAHTHGYKMGRIAKIQIIFP
jgi:hypothetical protein